MQITGNITNIAPDGSYEFKGNTIYTFQMSIDDGSGNIQTGQIGSKKNVYPANIGDEIIVNVTTNNHGTSFKKVNPNFNNGGGGGQQQAPRQQGGYTPPSQESPDWDKIARGKCACTVICAAIQSNQIDCKTAEDVERWVDFMMDMSK